MHIQAAPIHPSEAERACDVVAAAFHTDLVWSWAFPDPVARRRFFAVFVQEALRFAVPLVFKTSNFEAVSVWTPPNESEFSAVQEASLPQLLDALLGTRAAEVGELLDRFANAHPHHAPHYYLGLLECHPAHQGHGWGMALLKENLTRVDAHHMPAYLESSNPANNPRYAALGFQAINTFQAPGNGPVLTGMWREAH